MSLSALLIAPADELLIAAKEFAPAADRHWSRLCVLLGRIEDEHLYGEYPSARAFAEAELDVQGAEYVTLAKLWRMIQGATTVPIEAWASLSKSKALLVRKVVSLGADPLPWVGKAMAAKTSVAGFRDQVAHLLGEEPWTRIVVAVPTSLVELVETALVKALPVALEEPNPPAERAKDRDARFRALEVLAKHYLDCEAES